MQHGRGRRLSLSSPHKLTLPQPLPALVSILLTPLRPLLPTVRRLVGTRCHLPSTVMRLKQSQHHFQGMFWTKTLSKSSRSCMHSNTRRRMCWTTTISSRDSLVTPIVGGLFSSLKHGVPRTNIKGKKDTRPSDVDVCDSCGM